MNIEIKKATTLSEFVSENNLTLEMHDRGAESIFHRWVVKFRRYTALGIGSSMCEAVQSLTSSVSGGRLVLETGADSLLVPPLRFTDSDLAEINAAKTRFDTEQALLRDRPAEATNDTSEA